MILRRVSVFIAGVVATVLAVAAISWACTLNHQGTTWFCNGGTCGSTFKITHWTAGASVTEMIQGAVGTTTYTLYYKTGQNAGDACHDSATGNWGTITTDSAGAGSKSISTSGFSSGGYSACPWNSPDPNGIAVNHTNFTID